MLRSGMSVACAAFLAIAAASAVAYPENLLSKKMGASVSTTAKLAGKDDPNALLSDGPVSHGGFVFADVEQPQVFVVDLGQARRFDRVQLGAGQTTSRVRISVAEKSAVGPYQQVYANNEAGCWQVCRLPLVKARWVKFDFGTGGEALGVHSVRIYRSYEHPRLARVTKLLYERIKSGLPGLEKFYAYGEKGDWPQACKALRAYYAAKLKPAKSNPREFVAYAQAVADGKLDYCGLQRVDKIPIDWSYMKTNDWYEHRNILNRGNATWSPMVAYWNTGDPKWLKLFRDVFYDWIDANPRPVIMSRADYPTWRTLDSACRVGWITFTFPFVTAAKGVDDELWANQLYSIWEHADYLKNDDFDGGNWLATVMSVVMTIAMENPEFKDQKRWLEFGRASFETNVSRDVHPDGKEMEDAPGYVCMACGAMIGTMEALDKAGIEVSKDSRDRLDRSATFIAAITQPNGNMPMIGDWGGGTPNWLLDFSKYLKREDVRYVVSKGKQGVKPDWASINFPQGNWSVMRSPYEEQPYENARHLVIKMSRASHGHNDVLGITNYAYGRELLIDPGIRSYEHADVVRYLATAYHNTITIDGKNQEGGPGKTEKWVSNAGLDYVLGSHDRYTGLVHSRGVVFVKPDYWIVLDSISGEGNHTYDQNWHFKEGAGLTGDPVTKAVRTSYPSGGNLLMVPVDTEGLASEPIDFVIAADRMGKKAGIPSKGWKYARTGTPPKTMDLVLYPYAGAQAPNVTVKRLKIDDTPNAMALQVNVDGNVDYVFISRSGAVSASIPEAGLKVDGETVVIRTVNGKAVRVSGSNVRSVVLNGSVIFRQDQPALDLDKMLD